MSDKELFERLLEDLQKSLEVHETIGNPHHSLPHPIPASFYRAIKKETTESNPLALARHYKFCKAADVLKTMKSTIFHEGGVRGAALRGKEGEYRVWAIKDLPYFILEITSLLVMQGTENLMRDSIRFFDIAINDINKLEWVAKNYRSKKAHNKLIKMGQDLQKMKDYLIEKEFPSLPMEIKKLPDRVDLLIQLFLDQVRDAPDDVMSKAISMLLLEFLNFHMESEAIRQRIIKAKKKIAR